MMKKSACLLFRTHCWNETVEFNFNFLRKNTTFDIFILLNDEKDNLTKNFSDLNCEIISSKLSDFEERGFPIHPKGLWYTGDYQVIDALLLKDYDYALMVEYDCFINFHTLILFMANPLITAVPFSPTIDREACKSTGLAAVVASTIPSDPL